jgi:hypothetical protein
MSEIDIERLKVDADYWSLCGAPEDATHYAPEEGVLDPCWIKFDGQWRAKCVDSTNGNWGFDDPDCDPSRYISRPTKQEWDGGLLPEVGVECEFIHPGITSEGWQVGTIKAYFDDRVVIKSNPSIWPSCGYAVILIDEELKFRPLKSQQERRQREELLSILENTDYSTHGQADAILSRYNLEPKQ